ncbi:hypothetical protein Ciccas_010733 [Cichlidogyrus casuarinus]|uniref:Uncharacterized protein n=1 Tax=Cichlidogyrus casuarinus TaxID=1844966 RepID=A0ABD2PTD4_9PLAT
MSFLYTQYNEEKVKVNALNKYRNIMREIQATVTGKLTESFYVLIMKLFAAILDHFHHDQNVEPILEAVENLMTTLAKSFTAEVTESILIEVTKDILLQFINDKLTKTSKTDFAKVHLAFHNELSSAMKSLKSSKTLLVTSNHSGKKTDQICFKCGIYRESDDLQLGPIAKDLWTVEVKENDMLLTHNGQPYNDQEQLKLYMKALLDMIIRTAKFATSLERVKASELCVLLAIFMVYKKLHCFSFLEECFNQLASFFFAIKHSYYYPLCMDYFTSIARNVLVREGNNRFQLQMEGEQISSDCREWLYHFMWKFRRYLEMMLFFCYHEPKMVKKGCASNGAVKFTLLMDCSSPWNFEEWTVTMPSDGSPLTYDFDPTKKSRFALCWKGDLTLLLNLSLFYMRRIKNEVSTGMSFENFETYVKLILIVLIWRMSEADDQQKVDEHVKEFLSVLKFLNALICKYAETTMANDAFNHVIKAANTFYSTYLTGLVQASKSDAKWTQMADKLYHVLTMQDTFSMSTEEYMIHKGHIIHIEEQTESKSYTFTFRNGQDFYRVLCQPDAKTGRIKCGKSLHEGQILKLLSSHSDSMSTSQLLICSIFVEIYTVENMEHAGERWKNMEANLENMRNKVDASTYASLKGFIRRNNLNVKAVSQVKATDFSSFLESNPTSTAETNPVDFPVCVYEEDSKEERDDEVWECRAIDGCNNTIYYDQGNKIALWSVDVHSADERNMSRISFRRNQNGGWEAAYLTSTNMSVKLDEAQLDRLFEQIVNYSKNSGKLEFDCLRELILFATIVILTLKQFSTAAKYCLKTVIKNLHEDKKVKCKLDEIEHLYSTQSVETIVFRIATYIPQANLTEFPFKWAQDNLSVEMVFYSGTQYMRLKEAHVRDIKDTEPKTLSCHQNNLVATLFECISVLNRIVKLTEEEEIDVLVKVVTASFYIYRTVQCDAKLKEDERSRIVYCVVKAIEKSCYFSGDSQGFMANLIPMFERVDYTESYEAILKDIQAYTRAEFSVNNEIEPLCFGYQKSVVEIAHTFDKTGFYLESDRSNALTVSRLKEDWFQSYIKYVSTSEALGAESLVSSMKFLLYFATYLTATNQNADFIRSHISIIFDTLKSKLINQLEDIRVIETWVIETLNAILSGQYNEQEPEYIFGNIESKGQEILQSTSKTQKTRVKSDLRLTLAGLLTMDIAVDDGRIEFSEESGEMLSVGRVELLLNDIMARPHNYVSDILQVTFVRTLIILVCMWRTILLAKFGSVTEACWEEFLKKLIQSFGQKLLGDDNIMDYLKGVFFGAIRANVKSLFEYAGTQDKMIKVVSHNNSIGRAKKSSTKSSVTYIFDSILEGSDYDVETVTVRKRVGNGAKNETILYKQGILHDVENIILKIHKWKTVKIESLKEILKILISLILALMVIESKNPSKQKDVKPIVDSLEQVRSTKVELWASGVIGELDKTCEVLRHVHQLKVRVCPSEMAAKLLNSSNNFVSLSS